MSENEASNGSSKSSEGPSSGSSRLDSTASGSSGMSAVNSSSSGLGPSPHGSVDSSAQHSHISSLKTSVTHSDSAYGGSNTQSQRSGSGSGSRSSKSQISSNSSNKYDLITYYNHMSRPRKIFSSFTSFAKVQF